VEGKKHRIQVVGSATSPWATVSRLGWSVDAAALESGVTLTVYLYSFSAEKWVRAGKRIRLEPAASAYLGEVRRPERFVDPLTGEIRVMVQGKAPSGKLPDGFELRIDRLALEGLP
jgi:hypothetical protein